MSWGHRFAKNFDTLAYQGQAPTHLYLGHKEWDEFQDYIEPMRRYSVKCEAPLEDCNAIYRDVRIIRVMLETYWRFVQ